MPDFLEPVAQFIDQTMDGLRDFELFAQSVPEPAPIYSTYQDNLDEAVIAVSRDILSRPEAASIEFGVEIKYIPPDQGTTPPFFVGALRRGGPQGVYLGDSLAHHPDGQITIHNHPYRSTTRGETPVPGISSVDLSLLASSEPMDGWRYLYLVDVPTESVWEVKLNEQSYINTSENFLDHSNTTGHIQTLMANRNLQVRLVADFNPRDGFENQFLFQVRYGFDTIVFEFQ